MYEREHTPIDEAGRAQMISICKILKQEHEEAYLIIQ